MELIRNALLCLKEDGVETWFDGEIETGSDWDESIRHKLYSARVVIFLASFNSFRSDYIRKKELPAAIRRKKDGKCHLVVIRIGHVPKDIVFELDKMQWLLSDKPFAFLNEEEKQLFCVQLVKQLQDYFRENAGNDGVSTELPSEPTAWDTPPPPSPRGETDDFEHPFAEPPTPMDPDPDDPTLWPPPASRAGPSKILVRFLIRNQTAHRLRVWFWHHERVQDPSVPDFSRRWRMAELETDTDPVRSLYSNLEDFPPGPTYFVVENRDSRSIAQTFEGWHGFAPGETVTLDIPPDYFKRAVSEGLPQLIHTPAAPPGDGRGA